MAWTTAIVTLFSIALYAIAHSFLSLLHFENIHEAAAGIAAIPVMGSPHIYELLERQRAKKAFRSKSIPIVHTYEGFAISWWMIVLSGVIIMAAMLQFAGGLVFVTFKVLDIESGSSDQDTIAAVGLLSIPFYLFGSYLVGKWIGTRCSGKGIAAIVLVTILSALAAKAVDLVIIPSAQFEQMFGSQKDVALYLLHSSGLSAILFVGTTIGFWRGHKNKMSRYLEYLLSVLPKEIKGTILDLAYDEAKRAR
jgi:hypothetical protein